MVWDGGWMGGGGRGGWRGRVKGRWREGKISRGKDISFMLM